MLVAGTGQSHMDSPLPLVGEGPGERALLCATERKIAPSPPLREGEGLQITIAVPMTNVCAIALSSLLRGRDGPAAPVILAAC